MTDDTPTLEDAQDGLQTAAAYCEANGFPITGNKIEDMYQWIGQSSEDWNNG